MTAAKNTMAHLALLGTQLFFAINYSAIKALTGGGLIGPFGLNLLRVIITLALLWSLFLLKPVSIRIHKKDYWRFLAGALTGIVINQLLFVKGLSMTYSIHATLLMLSTPIVITLMAALLLKEKMSVQKIIGLALGVTGATLLMAYGNKSSEATDVVLGDLFIVINAISYSFYFIIVKPLMKEYDPMLVLRIVFTIGFFFMLPFCQNEFLAINWSGFTGHTFVLLFLVTVCGTFLAYLFNIYGLRHLGASIAGAYIYVQPFMTTVIAMLFMNERLDLYKVIAGMLIFAGVYLANKKSVASDLG